MKIIINNNNYLEFCRSKNADQKTVGIPNFDGNWKIMLKTIIKRIFVNSHKKLRPKSFFHFTSSFVYGSIYVAELMWKMRVSLCAKNSEFPISNAKFQTTNFENLKFASWKIVTFFALWIWKKVLWYCRTLILTYLFLLLYYLISIDDSSC